MGMDWFYSKTRYGLREVRACLLTALIHRMLILPHCLVLGLYSKSGGKNGKHCWASDSSNISALSYIPVQLFEPMERVSRQFRHVARSCSTLSALHLSRFALLPATSFLCMLENAPRVLAQTILISPTDNARFIALNTQVSRVIMAIKDLTRKPRRKQSSRVDRVDDTDGSDED